MGPRTLIGGRVHVRNGVGLVLALLLSWLEQAGAISLGAPAPEISGEPWINSQPVSIGHLRGRVVMVEFWTYG